MECLLFAGGECWIKDDFLNVDLSRLPWFLPLGVYMKAGRGELTLLTSSSCFISCSSDFSLSEPVVRDASVSIEEESEQSLSPLLLFEPLPGGVLLSTALVLCLWAAGEEKVGFWLTLSFTKLLEGSMSA